MSAEKHRGFAFVEFELAEVRGEGAAEPGSCPPPAGSGAGCCCHGRPGGPLCPLQLPGFPWAEARSLPVGFCLVGTPRCCSFAVPESAQGLPHRAFLPSQILVSLGKVLPRRL